MVHDPYTGKPVDRVVDLLPSGTGERCDHCGAEIINHCLRCGAPQCCPRCCAEAAAEERKEVGNG